LNKTTQDSARLGMDDAMQWTRERTTQTRKPTTTKNMNAQVREYNAAKLNRKNIIRANAGLRMSGKKHLVQPVPELPPKPVKFLLEDLEGNYIGTEWNEEFARDYARENNCKLTVLPFDHYQ